MPVTIKELQEQRARIVANARAKFDEIKDDTPDERAADIEREFDAMMADADSIEGKIQRMSRLEAVERALDSAPDPRRPVGESGEVRGAERQEGPTYREAFHDYLRHAGDMSMMSGEARAVLQGGARELPETRAQTVTAAEGGYMVPQELANILVKTMAAWGPMYDPGVTTEIVTTGGYTITMPTVDDTAVTPVAHTEGATLTDDGGKDVTFGQKTLGAFAYNTEWIRVSKELMDDAAFNVEAILGDLLGERLGRKANLELTVGDGTGDPNGIVTASSKGLDASAADAITANELIDLLHSVDPAYRASPRFGWQFNDATLAMIRKLKDSEGRYIFQEANISAGIPATLLGYRYFVNQAMPAATTGLKPIIVGDFGRYYVRKVGAPLIGAIQDKDFWPGFGIAGYIRIDGELADASAVKHILMA